MTPKALDKRTMNKQITGGFRRETKRTNIRHEVQVGLKD